MPFFITTPKVHHVPMAWCHRRDKRWQHPNGAQALGCTQRPHFLGSPDQSRTRLGQLKRD